MTAGRSESQVEAGLVTQIPGSADRSGREIDCDIVVWRLRRSAVRFGMEFDRHRLRIHDNS